ncbi:ion transporter [Ekhidna sp.]|uniref:ion transporter n=1 Tax=Ekhidna sp. TaxID=2608089 RepID=UPI003BAA6CB9
MRSTIYRIIEPSKKKNGASHYFDIFIIILILLNVLAIILESEESLRTIYRPVFRQFEIFSVIVFSIEYLLRVWTATEKVKYSRPIIGRLRFMTTPIALIDLFAILPFYLPFIGIDLRFLRIMRLFRVFRILKMARYSKAFDLIQKVLKEKKEELVITLGLISIILVIISTLMYYVERDAQPEHFSSISKSIWWGIVTLTTVGYGDIYPITRLGKFLGGIITLMSVGLIALPSGIIASGYTEQILERKRKRN